MLIFTRVLHTTQGSCNITHKKLSRYHAGAKGRGRTSSYSFLTSALDGVSGQRHVPTMLYPGKGPTIPIG
jgi:hypothetical protein